MTVFEKVTASPETLGELLASLMVIDSPWEEAFHRAFCDSCIDSNGTENCDTPGCPHEAVRNNPLWWLAQTVEGTQVADAAPCGDTERQAVGFNDFSGLFSAEVAKSLGLKANRDTYG